MFAADLSIGDSIEIGGVMHNIREVAPHPREEHHHVMIDKETGEEHVGPHCRLRGGVTFYLKPEDREDTFKAVLVLPEYLIVKTTLNPNKEIHDEHPSA